MSDREKIRAHYGTEPLGERVERALADAGLGAEIEPAALATMDQFHVRGIEATRQLAAALDPRPGASVLDLGSGLGGPARLLAAERDCTVTGVDLSDEFVAVATLLTARTGLSDRVRFSPGDVTALPFEDDSFDHAWTLHVAMNIADRAGFYAEARRVVKPGGRFAIYDVVEGNGEPPTFPVPWATNPETSFLLTAVATGEAIERAGFTAVAVEDQTERALAWFAQLQSAPPPSPGARAVGGLETVMGPEFPIMGRNLFAALNDGRIGLVQVVATA